MPTYRFRNLDTGIEYEKYMGVTELDEYKKHNNVKQLITGLNYSTNPETTNKVPDGFRTLLNKFKKDHG